VREEGDTTTTRKECHEEQPGRYREEGTMGNGQPETTRNGQPETTRRAR
jgi:hypothetical protein